GLSASVFLGAFYVLVGLHAAHVTFGAVWMILLFIHYKSSMPKSLFFEKFKIFSYYWHSVDFIWVFIIIIVYLPYFICKFLSQYVTLTSMLSNCLGMLMVIINR